ncbi:family 1 glycosyltransferase [Microdochium trichocladiopsis]|uniref:Alpha-1,3/1,6-mannosyltransferase ALG2 n=1 Tax=Microdochium trichocladiopsis TaxID=1682393 RepID=A0A9P8XXE0_9PEZI|nr:family 1 glycosyltransferase [Microdochium trichocladiopsis]KAH7021137.1 family 1 glycosyltransferase [Microdochium trichocladiopsis]
MAGKQEKPSAPKTIVFLHPDLGIGGAERLVVDAAVGLQKQGHKVVIFTSHCDPKHCFDEARDGTLDVRVRGDSIVPPSILARFSILCAILRQLHLIIQIYLSSELRSIHPDAYFVDQLSAGLPLLRWLHPEGRIFFYCHFPDLLLAKGRQKWWKRAYRVPFDIWEQWSMSFADAIAVNSDFTKSVVAKTWPDLARRKDLITVYPCVDTSPKTKSQASNDDNADKPLWNGKKFVLSINRFERKKDIELAIKAFARLDENQRKDVRLVLAGGYDNRVVENVEYHKELAQLAESLGLSSMTAKTLPTAMQVPDDVQVLFLQSVPNLLKEILLASARLLVYTPSNEHFGIVPLEAMLAGVPVLAANTGGPRETVVDGKTGWLRSPDRPDEWADVMDQVLNRMSTKETEHMSRAGIDRVKQNFGELQMSQRLDHIFTDMADKPRSSARPLTFAVLVVAAVAGAVVAAVGLAMLRTRENGEDEAVVWAEA